MKKQESKIPMTPEDVRQMYWETIVAMKDRKLDARQGREVLDGILKLSREIRAETKHAHEIGPSTAPLLSAGKKND